jgi:hypothetical protein
LFDSLSEISNLPRYFTAMTSAEPVGQDEVHVVADVDGVTREGEAWFRVDRERRHLEWDPRDRTTITATSTSPVTSGGSSVTVFLHTERHDPGDIDRGITDTLAEIKQLVEAGTAPGPAS